MQLVLSWGYWKSQIANWKVQNVQNHFAICTLQFDFYNVPINIPAASCPRTNVYLQNNIAAVYPLTNDYLRFYIVVVDVNITSQRLKIDIFY